MRPKLAATLAIAAAALAGVAGQQCAAQVVLFPQGYEASRVRTDLYMVSMSFGGRAESFSQLVYSFDAEAGGPTRMGWVIRAPASVVDAELAGGNVFGEIYAVYERAAFKTGFRWPWQKKPEVKIDEDKVRLSNISHNNTLRVLLPGAKGVAELAEWTRLHAFAPAPLPALGPNERYVVVRFNLKEGHKLSEGGLQAVRLGYAKAAPSLFFPLTGRGAGSRPVVYLLTERTADLQQNQDWLSAIGWQRNTRYLDNVLATPAKLPEAVQRAGAAMAVRAQFSTVEERRAATQWLVTRFFGTQLPRRPEWAVTLRPPPHEQGY